MRAWAIAAADPMFEQMFGLWYGFAEMATVGALIALVVLIFSFIAIIVRWKTAHRRRHIIRLLIAVLAIPCLIGIRQLAVKKMAENFAARAEKLAGTSLVRVGDPAPQISLTTADGDEFSLNDAAGDVVLINFFARSCESCQDELPLVEEIWLERRNDERFRLLVIGREETTESVAEYRDEKGFTFPVAADPDRAVHSLFAEECVPRTLVVSPAGEVVYSEGFFYLRHWHGGDHEELKSVLEAQLAAIPE